MINRRTFLLNTAAATAATMLGTEAFAGGFKKKKIGLQLYSLREDVAGMGLEKTFQKISAAGYSSVEMFGFNAKDNFFKTGAKDVAGWLKVSNLISPSGHYSIDLFDNDGQQTIDAAKELGNRYIVIPWLPENLRKSLEDYKSLAERVNKAALMCKNNDIKMLYHNHDFEFKKYEGDVCGYDILLQQCDKDLVNFEMDLYWVVTAGRSPVELFTQHPGRFKMWHVKDKDKTNPKLQTEVGSGSIDFKPIFAKARLSGLEYFYVEQENFAIPSDESIRKSIAFVKRELL